MDAKNIVLIGVAAALTPLVQNAAIEEHQPACGIEARPDVATALVCQEKQPAINHDERDTASQTYRPVVGITVTPVQYQSSGATVTIVSP
jgi:hypothetical protein